MCMLYAREKNAYKIELYKFICCILFNFIFAVDSSFANKKEITLLDCGEFSKKKKTNKFKED